MSQPWKVILAFAGVFLAGAIAGGPLALRLLRHGGSEHHSWRGLGPQIMRHFADRLDLTPAQKEKIRPIIQRAQQETQRLRRENIRNVAATIEQMQAAIAAELTPAQRIKLDEMRRHMRQRAEHFRNEFHDGARRPVPDGWSSPPPDEAGPKSK
jgi:Spy/CpxP family protein refolding chaperone